MAGVDKIHIDAVLQQPVAQRFHAPGVGGEGAHGLLGAIRWQRGDEFFRASINAG